MIWVVFRGFAGMADRMGMLGWILRQAIETKRLRVCVDWRDLDWSGGHPGLDFDTFFDIRGVPTVTLSEVLHRMRGSPKPRVFPEDFTAELLAKPPSEAEWNRFTAGFAHRRNESQRAIPDQYDIVIIQNREWRHWSGNVLLHCLRLKPAIWRTQLEPHLARFLHEFSRTQTRRRRRRGEPQPMVVHLRGTDRAPADDPRAGVLGLLYATRLLCRNKRPMKFWVIGDSPDLIMTWMTRRFTQSEVAFHGVPTRRIIAPRNMGIHKLSEDLSGVPRFDQNMDALRDFLLLALAEPTGSATTASASYFAHLATLLGANVRCWWHFST